MPAELKLYVKKWCPWCRSAEHYLNKRGYRYDELDVNRDDVAYEEMIKISGQTFTPTLVVDGKVLADFGPEELEQFLNKNNILP